MADPNRYVHAYVWSTLSVRWAETGHKWDRRRTRRVARTWHFIVMVGDRIVMYDNTGAYKPMMQEAVAGVVALRRLVTSGHPLKQYDGSYEMPPSHKFQGAHHG